MKSTGLNVNFGENINEISFEKHFFAYLAQAITFSSRKNKVKK